MKWVVRVFAGVFLMTTLFLMLARRESSGAWIAFASVRGGDESIYLMTGDGQHQRKIARDLSCATAPQWSLNGRWIAFTNPCVGSQDLMRIRPGGFALHVVSSVPSYLDVTRWSPDREQLARLQPPSSLYIYGHGWGRPAFPQGGLLLPAVVAGRGLDLCAAHLQ